MWGCEFIEEYVNKNLVGNCIELMAKLPKDSIHLIVTDPPYNASEGGIDLPNNQTGGPYYKVNEEWDKFGNFANYLEFTNRWIKECDKALSPTGSIMVCCSLHNIGEIIVALKEMNYKFINLITWRKTNPMPNITKRMLTHSTEFVVWFAKGKGWTFNYEEMKKYNKGKQLRDVWEFPICQGEERLYEENGRAAHPTQKPLALIQRLIEAASNPSDIVLDPFMGTGTTAVASISLQRKWIGIESNPEYVELAHTRIEEYKKRGIQVTL